MKLFVEKKSIVLIAFLSLTFALFADTSYKVEKGDTLYSISRKYQITVAELRAANNLSENDIIKIGQKLIIPQADISTAAALVSSEANKTVEPPKTTQPVKPVLESKAVITPEPAAIYIVEKGDTLYGIAKKTGVSVAEIVSLNNIDTSAVIKIGQKLKLRENSTEAVLSEAPKKETVTEKSPEPKKETTSGKVENKKTEEPKKSQEEKITINLNGEDKTPDTRTYGNTVNSDSSTVWPVKNPKITTVKGKVSGVQLSAQKDEPVICIREGTVMYVGVYRGFGQVVFVQSKTGVIYAYTGLGSVKVKKGDYLNFGTELGSAGVDSLSGKSQITFMVFQNGKPIDPAKAPRN